MSKMASAAAPRLHDLVFVDHEILAQDRNLSYRPHLADVFEAPFEIGCVGQHAQACCAVGLVDARDRDRIEIRANDPGRGAGLLDFGDEANTARADQGASKIASARRCGRLGTKLVEGFYLPRASDLLALGAHDFVEDGHAVNLIRQLPRSRDETASTDAFWERRGCEDPGPWGVRRCLLDRDLTPMTPPHAR